MSKKKNKQKISLSFRKLLPPKDGLLKLLIITTNLQFSQWNGIFYDKK